LKKCQNDKDQAEKPGVFDLAFSEFAYSLFSRTAQADRIDDQAFEKYLSDLPESDDHFGHCVDAITHGRISPHLKSRVSPKART